MKTYADLKNETLRFFDAVNEDANSADVVLVGNAINNANQKRVSEDKWAWMLSPIRTLTTVVGQSSYILPSPNLLKFHYLRNLSTLDYASSAPADMLPELADFQCNITYTVTDAGSTVQAQPPTPDTLALTSTVSESASLYVEGEDANGAFISETIDPSETSTQTFSRVDYYAKTGDWDGLLTLAATGGTTILTLTAEETGKEYPVLTFTQSPTSVGSWQYRYFRKPRVLTRDLDRPDLPFPHSGILVYDALLDLATYNELDSESVNIWRAKQQEYLDILYLQKLDGDTIAGLTQRIHG